MSKRRSSQACSLTPQLDPTYRVANQKKVSLKKEILIELVSDGK